MVHIQQALDIRQYLQCIADRLLVGKVPPSNRGIMLERRLIGGACMNEVHTVALPQTSCLRKG